MDLLVSGIVGLAAGVMEPGGDQIVQRDGGPVRSYYMGKTGPHQELYLFSSCIRRFLPKVFEHGLGDRRSGRVHGQQFKACSMLRA